jgi:arsenate reductase
MAELGINILPQGVHALGDYVNEHFDLVVTVCDQAEEECPVFPGAAQQLHWGFADPSRVEGTEELRLRAFRHTRDLIIVRLQQWLAEHGEQMAREAGTAPGALLPSAAADPAYQSLPAAGAGEPTRVLILCTGNSARSQMAEAWLHSLGGSGYAVQSAGTHPTTVNPLAVQVMAERHIDISHARSKSVDEFVDQPFDYVITVCDRAAEACPFFPGNVQRLHWSFPDPAAETGSLADRLQAFRTVRDALYLQFWFWITGQLPINHGEGQAQRVGEYT